MASSLLTACASGAEPGPVAPAAAPGEAFPVTIEHAYGTAQIPARPERVVSLGYTEQDAILAFGVVPVAVRHAFGPEDDVFFPWADAAAGDAKPTIMPRAAVDIEMVAAAEPDLIMAVTAGLEPGEYEKLSAIAPVVVQPKEFVAFGTPWQDQTRITGRALGQPERAEQLVAEVEGRFAAARARYPQLQGRTLALTGPVYEGQYPVHATDDTRTRFFGELGLVVPEELDALAGENFYGGVSKEQVGMLDTDLLVWQSGSAEERAGIEADTLLAALPVVAQGRAVFAEGADYDALQFSSALSLPYLLDGLAPKLAAAADRPST